LANYEFLGGDTFFAIKVKREVETQSEMPGTRARMILNSAAAVIALAGLGIAVYLSVMALSGETAACGGSAGCAEVLGSSYAKIAGVPIALLGILGYFAVFCFATFAAFGYKQARLLLGVTVSAMFCMTLWLLYVQAFLLHAFCRYCLFSAAFTFLLAGLAVAGMPPREIAEEE
jgi:uncharacterized membrane protein